MHTVSLCNNITYLFNLVPTHSHVFCGDQNITANNVLQNMDNVVISGPNKSTIKPITAYAIKTMWHLK